MTLTTGNAKTLRRSILAIAMLLLAALLSLGAIRIAQGSAADNRTVQVLDGDGVQHSFPLAENGTHTIETERGSNTIEIKDGSVTMLFADCPNGDCIEQADIHESSEMILCLPHQLMVSISSDTTDADNTIDTVAGL
ncbi:MAG: NusG domain II-containing protein [Raoultibacter sp.]